jgi:WhiB family transcriptional regulator, redox-sensing transcriptional regulator
MSRSSRRRRRQRAARQMRRSRRFNTVRVAVAVPLLAAAPSLRGAGTLTATVVAKPAPLRRPVRRRRENHRGFSLVKPPPSEPATIDKIAELGLEPDPGGNWRKQALCAETDPEAFFPEKGGSPREAKKICQRCGVRAACLANALERDERFGIWGGLSERERRRLKTDKSAFRSPLPRLAL